MNTTLGLKAAISVNEFCQALSIGRTLFYERVAAGQIKVLKIGTRTLVPIGEIQAFLDRAAGEQR